MKTIHLFCDSSVNPQSKIGVGAYLYFENELSLTTSIQSKVFYDTSSTKLELQTLLWAIQELNKYDAFIIYTDCQNILSLLKRREKLENNNYLTRTHKKIKHTELYKAFFILIDQKKYQFIKVKGHKKSSQKDTIDQIFSQVDKFSRKTLRELL